MAGPARSLLRDRAPACRLWLVVLVAGGATVVRALPVPALGSLLGRRDR